MYLYLSLVERKVAQFYHNMERRRYLVWLKCFIFITIWRELLVSLSVLNPHDCYASRTGRGNWQLWKREKRGGKPLTSLSASCTSTVCSVEELAVLLFNASWDYLVEVNVRKRHPVQCSYMSMFTK